MLIVVASLVDSSHASPLNQLHPRGRQPHSDGLLHWQSPIQLQGSHNENFSLLVLFMSRFLHYSFFTEVDLFLFQPLDYPSYRSAARVADLAKV